MSDYLEYLKIYGVCGALAVPFVVIYALNLYDKVKNARKKVQDMRKEVSDLSSKVE